MMHEISRLQYRLQDMADEATDLEVAEAIRECVRALDMIQCRAAFERAGDRPTKAQARADHNAEIFGLREK